MHACNSVYKLEPPAPEDEVKELMKETDFGYLGGGPGRAANQDLPRCT